jgi:hypothetical protein
VHFRGKQIYYVSDAPLNLRDLQLVLFKRVSVDDCRINPLQIEQIIDVFGRAAGYDGKNLHGTTVIHHPSDLGGEMDGGALQKTASQTYRPGIQPGSYLFLAGNPR